MSSLRMQRAVMLSIGIFILVAVALVLLARLFFDSLYMSRLDRVNIAVWGPQSYVMSLSRVGKQHYMIMMSNAYTVQVPGGLAGYSIGSLGKLATLEKDPRLYMKAMGVGAGVFIHKYLYDSEPTIYYDDVWLEDSKFAEIKNHILKSTWLAGNMNIFDRLWMYATIRSTKPAQMTIYKVRDNPPDVLLYDKLFRDEQKLVQLGYVASESTASFLARILENTGIRVADISRADSTMRKDSCTIVDSQESFSQTALFLAGHFGCVLEYGDTSLYDIYWVLDEKIEREWSM
ncbi:MAG TPA: hypothetical protein PKJ68_02065 [Candidatus Woesebacteria bacterium]|nr:hypothetical protein [Candidatus Woesebacteria bacterium]